MLLGLPRRRSLEDGALLLGESARRTRNASILSSSRLSSRPSSLLPRWSPRDDFGTFAGADVASLIAAG
jgi:hypothetical protein